MNLFFKTLFTIVLTITLLYFVFGLSYEMPVETILFVTGWLSAAFLLASIGIKKRVGYLNTLILSLFLSPLVALIIVLSSKNLADIKREEEILEQLKSLNNK